jgi:hypothetical protein
MPKFIRWETPFTDTRWPSAVIIVQPRLTGPYPVSVLIAPTGIDKYPKYLVHFGEVVAFTCMEEMHFPERDFADAICEEEGLGAYEYLESTWLKSYEQGEHFLFDPVKNERLRHYLIVGGDNNIEVITKNIPIFETVEDSRVMALEFVI